MLEREMDRYKVEVHCDETLQRIIPRKDLSGQNITGYEVQTDRDKYLVRKLILAVGGSAAPAQGTTCLLYTSINFPYNDPIFRKCCDPYTLQTI